MSGNRDQCKGRSTRRPRFSSVCSWVLAVVACGSVSSCVTWHLQVPRGGVIVKNDGVGGHLEFGAELGLMNARTSPNMDVRVGVAGGVDGSQSLLPRVAARVRWQAFREATSEGRYWVPGYTVQGFSTRYVPAGWSYFTSHEWFSAGVYADVGSILASGSRRRGFFASPMAFVNLQIPFVVGLGIYLEGGAELLPGSAATPVFRAGASFFFGRVAGRR